MSQGLDLHIDKNASRVGLLIAALATALVFVQIAGEDAQTKSISKTVEAADLWSFFQAKTIRKTVLETAADDLEMTAPGNAAAAEKIAKWRALAATYESEPDKGEGRRELMVRARAVEKEREFYAEQDQTFDIAAGALQIAILLASTAVITGVIWLAYLSGALGFGGAVLGAVAAWAPHLLNQTLT
jgi:uncharacterized protein (DUF2267 family)